MQQDDDVRVLLDAARFAQVGEQGLLVCTLLEVPVSWDMAMTGT